jgi:hypothetical protein
VWQSLLKVEGEGISVMGETEGYAHAGQVWGLPDFYVFWAMLVGEIWVFLQVGLG